MVHVGWDLDRKNRRNVLATFIALQERARASGVAAPVDRLIFVGPELVPDMARDWHRPHGVADAGQDGAEPVARRVCAHSTPARALLFPSLQEGFGWPVIEAQACGCPVFTSDLAPMNEIGGEGAEYVDPNDPQAMAAAIEKRGAALRRDASPWPRERLALHRRANDRPTTSPPIAA